MKSERDIICKLTGIRGPAVKSHIIPESFYLIPEGLGAKVKLVTDTAGHYPKRCPIGVYDQTILTKEGESRFQQVDDYAFKLLVRDWQCAVPINKNDKTIAYKIDSYDYERLKLFFIGVLWRAGVSTHPFFAKVKLGPHLPILAKMINDSDAGSEENYSVLLSVFDDNMHLPKMMDPFATRYESVKFYRFYFGSFAAEIKVDKRPTPFRFAPFQLAPEKPLLIAQRNFSGSKDQGIMSKLYDHMKAR